QAQVVAERVRRGTAEQRHEVPGSVEQARVTLSVGAAIVNGQNASATQMFEAAQTALARAKRDGGNQIEFEAVHAPPLIAIAAADPTPPATTQVQPRSAANTAVRRNGTPGVLSAWLRAHAHTVAVCSLAAIGIGICLVGAVAELDWAMLAVMLSLSTL